MTTPYRATTDQNDAGNGTDAHLRAKGLIKQAQKHIPKLVDYLNYLEYLRHHNPVRFDRAMQVLQQEDPQTWLKLQKYPQFRPLRNTALGLKAAEKHMTAGIGLINGKLTGSSGKWIETTLQEMMKRDRFGPYADVLGNKASTLPAPKNEYFSRSRYGQHRKEEVPKMEKAYNDAFKGRKAGEAAARAAKGTAVVRVTGTVVDLGIHLLDAEKAEGIGAEILRRKAQSLELQGVIGIEQQIEIQNLLSSGNYKAANQIMKDALIK